MEYKIDAIAILPRVFKIPTIFLDFSRQSPLRIPISAHNPQFLNAKKEHMRWLQFPQNKDHLDRFIKDQKFASEKTFRTTCDCAELGVPRDYTVQFE